MCLKPKYIVSLTIEYDLFWPYSLTHIVWRNGQARQRSRVLNGRNLARLKKAVESDSANGNIVVKFHASQSKSVWEFISKKEVEV